MTTSIMEQEARSAPQMVSQQLLQNASIHDLIGRRLRENPPTSVVTVARGSSDHAAGYLAYLVMSRLGVLTTSLPMSLVSLEKASLKAQGVLAIAISQSGQSPDVIEPMHYFGANGATTMAMVNSPESPLAHAVEYSIGLRAGVEHGLAATKSFIASQVASAQLVANWQEDMPLIQAIQRLPQELELAIKEDWSSAVDILAKVDRCMIAGRGLGHSLALETALKLKETCSLQAEAFSGAEIKHGPMVLIEPGYPLLVFALHGPALQSQIQLAKEMRERGARVILAAPQEVAERDLTIPKTSHPALEPIVTAMSFYLLAAQLAKARGLDPDKPRHLQKVTKTL